jgi:diketogulonate reductase-like aldo/keto reductase
MASTPHITLPNGITIPPSGLGVFQVPADDDAVVRAALDAGHRHIDTAHFPGRAR